MGKRIIAMFIAIAMIIALPVFSFAADTKVVNSGSTLSVMNRAVAMTAANENIALAAAADETGKYGWNIEPVNIQPVFSFGITTDTYFNYGFSAYLPAGTYISSISFNYDFLRFRVMDLDTNTILFNDSSASSSSSGQFILTDTSRVYVYAAFDSSVSKSNLTFIDFFLNSLTPVPGISCGYTYSVSNTESIKQDNATIFTWSFGDQPAGNYVVNAYHYGIAYDCKFNVAYGADSVGSNSRFLPAENYSGVTSILVTHGGGDLTLSGTILSWFVGDVGASEISGSLNLGTDYGYYSGAISDRDSWVFTVTDVVLVSLSDAGIEQYGILGVIVSSIRDIFFGLSSTISNLFSDLKLFLTELFADDEAEKDVEDAQTELDKEVAELDELSQDLGTYAGNIESQMQSDFAVSDEIMGQTDNVQLIWSGLFTSFGMWTIFFWLPPLLAVIRYVLRL